MMKLILMSDMRIAKTPQNVHKMFSSNLDDLHMWPQNSSHYV